MEKNPYAKADGTPAEGKIKEFMDWEQAQQDKALKAMSPKERREWLEGQRSLQRKMRED
jgi:hypothetical protein